jgi:hypothetical protein
MDKRSIFLLFELLCKVASDVQLDKEGFISSFVVPVGTDTPPWVNRPSLLTLTLVRFRNGSIALLIVW